jgi:hypothetical protein
VYRALAVGEEMPDEVIRWELAERFGWTLDYIDSLTLHDFLEYVTIQDGKGHASKSIFKKAQ